MAKQTQTFQAEIKQLLDMMIHSLYSHREIFLRELISNASDAIDKRKFEALQNEKLGAAEYKITLVPNAELKTLQIIDTGIGMSFDEVVENIGTIAQSGTKKFQQMNQELKDRPELIGQFGVGFYSAFMVADRVTLHTQKAGQSDAVLWESSGDGTYSIDKVPRAEGVGTTITLHLKEFKSEEEVQNFTDEFVLKSLIKKYSDFIAHPIVLKEETLNSQKALWLKSPSEIKEEEYTEFYKHISHDWEKPAKTIHFKAEGTQEFSALMFVPSQKPWNYHYREFDHGMSLYIKRVFIMDNCKDLVPTYLRFMKGLVDSSDLSLNVSREMLQQDKQVSQIKKALTSKILAQFKEMLLKDRTSYENFWTQFGSTLKEGMPQDISNKEKLQDLLLFHSTQSDKMTTLDEYVSRMPESQKDIYFITGDNLHQVSNSPYLEKLKLKGYEVLLLVDPVDEWVTDSLREFKGKKLQSITKEDLNLETEEEKKSKEEEIKKHQEKFSALMTQMKTSLDKNIKEIKISDRLTTSPVCLVSGAHDPSAHMEKLLSQMAQGPTGMPSSKRILEINPNHSVFEKMLSMNEADIAKYAEILYSQALLNEGSQIPDPVRFSQLVSEVMVKAH